MRLVIRELDPANEPVEEMDRTTRIFRWSVVIVVTAIPMIASVLAS